MDLNALNIYTDGSATPNPGNGGVGIKFVFPDYLEEPFQELDFCPPGYKQATNNQMEIKACILALKKAKDFECIKKRKIQRIIINTDSQQLINGCKNALHIWPRTKWRRVGGAPVLNVELWKELIKSIMSVGIRVDFEKVKGHSNNKNNNKADKLAEKSAENPQNSISRKTILRRKKTKLKTIIGSVKVLGQSIKIRIIDCEYLKTQKEYRFRYEVMSKRSKFYQKADYVFSKIDLRPGHEYLVRFNKNMDYPMATKVIKEY